MLVSVENEDKRQDKIKCRLDSFIPFPLLRHVASHLSFLPSILILIFICFPYCLYPPSQLLYYLFPDLALEADHRRSILYSSPFGAADPVVHEHKKALLPRQSGEAISLPAILLHHHLILPSHQSSISISPNFLLPIS